MRLACGLAIAVWLSFSAAGTPQQAPADSENAAGPASAAKEQVPAEPKPAAPKKTDASAANGTTKHRKRKPPAPDNGPRKIVVREGGASEPAAQIAPDLTPAEATRQRQNAEHVLSATDDQLKKLAERTLDARRQETVGQIHNYMDGARSALKEGDVQRANTLAEKAHLLADDLVKH